MPLSAKGNKIMKAMRATYGSGKKAEQVFYASRNAGKISGVEKQAGGSVTATPAQFLPQVQPDVPPPPNPQMPAKQVPKVVPLPNRPARPGETKVPEGVRNWMRAQPEAKHGIRQMDAKNLMATLNYFREHIRELRPEQQQELAKILGFKQEPTAEFPRIDPKKLEETHDMNKSMYAVPYYRLPEGGAAQGGEIGSLVEKALHIAHQQTGGALPLAGAPGSGAMEEAYQGPLRGKGAGRTDRHNIDVAGGSYVMPADTVSILGDGNNEHGQIKLNLMFGEENLTGGIKLQPGRGSPIAESYKKPMHGHPPMQMHMRKPSAMGHAEGGTPEEDDNVPIVAAPGEFVIPRSALERMWGGDMDKAHNTLDDWVLDLRAQEMKRLKNAPPPRK